jgi:hypothetical protein
VILGFYRSIGVLGWILITISYFGLSLLFAYFWLPFRSKRSVYWDIAATYIVLFIALGVRWILALNGFWAF